MKIIQTRVPNVSQPSMRDVRALLKANTSLEKVAEYKWRSAEEIACYLRGLSGTAEIAATTSLDRKKLSNAYSELVALQSRLDTLVGLDVAIAYDFLKHRSRLSPIISEIRKELEGKRDKALRVLQRTARKNEPEALRLAVAKAALFLSHRLASNYDSVNDYVYATPYGDSGLQFNHYIQIDALHNPSVDYTYSEYYVVLTARIKGQETTLHINTLHEFRAPGSFSVGEALLVPQLETVISALLHADEFVIDLDGTALPNIPLDVRNFRTPVQNLVILHNKIQGEFLCERSLAVQYTKSLQAELQSVFGRHLEGYVFKCNLTRKGINRWNCCYVAVPTTAKKGLDFHGVQLLRDQLNFTPDQIMAVRRLLLKGY